jgi:hypothetical protein
VGRGFGEVSRGVVVVGKVVGYTDDSLDIENGNGMDPIDAQQSLSASMMAMVQSGLWTVQFEVCVYANTNAQRVRDHYFHNGRRVKPTLTSTRKPMRDSR